MSLADLTDLYGALRHCKGVPDEAFGGVKPPVPGVRFVMVGEPEQPFSSLGEIPHDGAGSTLDAAPAVFHYGDQGQLPQLLQVAVAARVLAVEGTCP